jgi:predicted transcriptional regulator
MATTTIRVSEGTHKALRALAASTGETMTQLVERAVELLRTERFFAQLDDAYGRLQADPDGWEAEIAERRAWEATLGDGLEQE